MPNSFKSALLASVAALLAGSAFVTTTNAADFNIPGGDLKAALDSYSRQTGVSLLYSDQAIRGARSRGVQGDIAPDEALFRILSGTGFEIRKHEGSAITIVRGDTQAAEEITNFQIAQAAPAPRAAVETVTVTSSKLGGADVQSIPIAITALSQEQLTATQTAGGPDLVKQVPNLTFTKTNFTGYSIQIRGIGTQAISVTTDPAVAVALNDIPFIRNHFFEQEFYDVGQVEVLRGPQGTLYGRNATAGVVNLVTAKPTDQFEAMVSADIGNYKNRRFEAMLNLPIMDDRFDVRLAGEWTKRSGYTTNEVTGDQVDGRDLWSGRLTLGWKPLQNLNATLVWEHFAEADDRMRTSKQLCKHDPGRESVGGVALPTPESTGGGIGFAFKMTQASFSQGCLPASLYAPESFGVPNGYALPYFIAGNLSGAISGSVDPYASTVQSTNLRTIQTQINPVYKAKNDTAELNFDYGVTPSLTLTSQTAYSQDFLYSTEDYNRFNTSPDIFSVQTNGSERIQTLIVPNGHYRCSYTLVVDGGLCPGGYQGTPAGDFCDPQLGCSSRLVAQDVSDEHAWQLSQEFRLASNFTGPLNFTAGGNFLHYETEENYYVFANTLTLFAATSATGDLLCPGGVTPWIPGVTDNRECLRYGTFNLPGYQYNDPTRGPGTPTEVAYYIDPNDLNHLNGMGHNYFLSKNPYTLNSYAAFGEVNYSILPDLKVTGGIRWTDDQKHFTLIPSELLVGGYGYAGTGVVDQEWDKFTGRAVVNWTPQLDFTDQTLVYGSFARGYKAGGANPPGAVLGGYGFGSGISGIPTHPLTFDPEYVNAFELGTKNTLLDGAVTFNGNVFYYDYKGYQISEIVDRTSINLNFDATVRGAEVEATYEPLPGLRFRFAGGYEHTRIADGQKSVDLMDRTAGHEGWVVMRPYVQQSSNCIMPEYVVATLAKAYMGSGEGDDEASAACGYAYISLLDPYNELPYDYSGHPARGRAFYPQPDYPGFDPLSVDPNAPANVNNGLGLPPNNGAGFDKELGGNELPNAPPFTVSFSADYTLPVTADWAATLHGDYYWQDYSWARVFNDNPYDRLRGYTNINIALILTSQEGWQVMGYVKNIFDVTDITGTFLNSDDSGLTTNVFLTDPRLFGVRVTKNW
jgi:outer membrane receptor protein involved in Fe transport